MINGKDLAPAGCKYLGTPYNKMDCQAFVEKCLSDCGINKNLAGSNAWYREVLNHGWVGSLEECRKQKGEIPPGAFLFILKQDGNEPPKYHGDGIGNASHIGIYSGLSGRQMCEIGNASEGYNFGSGAIHSSSSRGYVCTSEFNGNSIPGGWNRVGLWDQINYGGDAVEAWKGRVVDGNLNLRVEPSTSSVRIAIIPDGTILTVTDETIDGSWGKTSYDGKTGWVMTRYLEEIKPDDGMILVSREDLQKCYDLIGNMLRG